MIDIVDLIDIIGKIDVFACRPKHCSCYLSSMLSPAIRSVWAALHHSKQYTGMSVPQLGTGRDGNCLLL